MARWVAVLALGLVGLAAGCSAETTGEGDVRVRVSCESWSNEKRIAATETSGGSMIAGCVQRNILKN